MPQATEQPRMDHSPCLRNVDSSHKDHDLTAKSQVIALQVVESKQGRPEQQIDQRGRPPSPQRRPAGHGPDPFQIARSSSSQRLAGLDQAGLPKPLGEAIVNVAQAPTDVVDA